MVHERLAHFLADVYTLYLMTQNFHWNVKGQNFYSLHILFEKQYEELAEEIDEVAERIRALGFFVEGTLAHFKEKTGLKEVSKVLSEREMLHHLVESHEHVILEGREISTLAEKANDPATVDMIGRRVGGHEKMAWMLRSSMLSS